MGELHDQASGPEADGPLRTATGSTAQAKSAQWPDLADPQSTGRPHVLLGLTGSVASIKAPEIAQLLCQHAEVKVVATDAAIHFFDEDSLPPAARPLLRDDGEWRIWQQKGDPVVHIELRKWADLFVVAPLSANSLAKMAQGMCDNLLTSVVRAWDFAKPLVLAPAMNTFMWDSPLTAQHLAVLRNLGAHIVPPVSKALACGDVGIGAMAEPATIMAEAKAHMQAALCHGHQNKRRAL